MNDQEEIILEKLDYKVNKFVDEMTTNEFQDFKCILCRKLFNPPYNLPYLLPCTHSLCTTCLQAAASHNQSKIICPEDLESNLLSQVKSNSSARRALERLLKEHKNYNQNNQLLCIQSLSKHFEQVLEGREKQKQDFQQLLEKIFKNEMNRLKQLEERIQKELNSPFGTVQEWKQMVRSYLSSLKGVDRSSQASNIFNELNYYIQEGRKIKQELVQYQTIQLEEIANEMIINPQICFSDQFSVRQWKRRDKTVDKYASHQIVGKSKNITNSGTPNESGTYHESDREQSKAVNKPKTVCAEVNTNFASLCRQQEDLSHSKAVSTSSKKSNKSNKKQFDEVSLSEKTQRRPVKMEYKKIDYATQKNEKSGLEIREDFKTEQPLKQITGNSNFLSSQNSSCADKKQLLVYSPEFETITQKQEPSHQFYDELLLTEKEEKKGWALGNYNFMKEWEVSHCQPIQCIEIKKRDVYNCERQRNNYIRRMQQLKAEEARSQASLSHNCLELINYSLQEVDMNLFLQGFDWNRLEVLKLVKTNICDSQFNEILNFALNSHLSTLVLCGNSLSQLSLDALLNFARVNSTMRNIYLSKNNINCLKGNSRTKIALLRQQGLNLYI